VQYEIRHQGIYHVRVDSELLHRAMVTITTVIKKSIVRTSSGVVNSSA
jgi:hypothetical protein